MYRDEATAAVTVTPLLSALVLQTQITKLAVCPAFTSEEVENDWILTHSSGVLALPVGELGDPLGDGLGLGEPVGLVLGLGELPCDSERDGDGLGAVELGDELGLSDALADGDGESEALVLTLALGDVLALALPDGVVLEDALAEPDSLAGTLVWPPAGAGLLLRPIIAEVSSALFGREEQVVLTMGGLEFSAARAWPARLKLMNANPATAPSATDRGIGALTCPTSPYLASGAA
jgi:hypothetical protein